ncbi:MAG: hypothetical protein ACLU38_16300 [Dysosmobacter sp.]
MQRETPLGAYAVEYLTYTVDDSARNYGHPADHRLSPDPGANSASMVYTTSISALHDLLTSAARSGSGELVVRWGILTTRRSRSGPLWTRCRPWRPRRKRSPGP